MESGLRELFSSFRLPPLTPFLTRSSPNKMKDRQGSSMVLSHVSLTAHRLGGGAWQFGRGTSRNLFAALLVSVVLVAPTVYLLSSSSSSVSSLSSPLLPFSASSSPQYDSLSFSEPPLSTGARRREEEKNTLLRSIATITDHLSPVEAVSPIPSATATTTTNVSNRTLVMYVYHESNEWYKDNLRFFIKVAMQDNDHDDVDYLLIINGESSLPLEVILATTAAQREGRVQLLRRPNTCYDGGSMGEVLRARSRLAESYRYYFLMNSSVRGPFLPRYFQAIFKAKSAEVGSGALAWTSVLTSLLDDEVKLAGTTISCMGQVHVQSMVLATDQLGLGLLLNGGVLDCPTSLNEAIRIYELGATTTILDAG